MNTAMASQRALSTSCHIWALFGNGLAQGMAFCGVFTSCIAWPGVLDRGEFEILILPLAFAVVMCLPMLSYPRKIKYFAIGQFVLAKVVSHEPTNLYVGEDEEQVYRVRYLGLTETGEAVSVIEKKTEDKLPPIGTREKVIYIPDSIRFARTLKSFGNGIVFCEDTNSVSYTGSVVWLLFFPVTFFLINTIAAFSVLSG